MNNRKLFSEKEFINLFWTGGWDSTFRLLQLLINDRKPVQTHYIIDPCRKSYRVELETMEKIREEIIKKYPFTKELFLKTKIISLMAIHQDKIITDAYQQADAKAHLGTQYDWLARYCKQTQITNMELGIQKLETPDHPPRFSPFYEKNESSQELIFKPSLKDEPEYILFNNFRFPILHLTKEAIYEIAKQNDWLKIMNKTWFCHEPIREKIPCGKCVPCQQIIDDKTLKNRIPFYIRLIRKKPASKFSKFLEEKFLSP